MYLQNRYSMSSTLFLLSRVFTVLYHITLPYHMYCIADTVLLLMLLKHHESGSFVKHTVITGTYWRIVCFSTVYGIYSKVQYKQYCKKEANQWQFVVAFFYWMTRRPSGGGRQRLFTQQQEFAIVDLVRANNAIRLQQLRQQILVFDNITRVSITTMWAMVLACNTGHKGTTFLDLDASW